MDAYRLPKEIRVDPIKLEIGLDGNPNRTAELSADNLIGEITSAEHFLYFNLNENEEEKDGEPKELNFDR